jgi:uncharacterized cupredoxin-like copper-binding protein
VLLAGLATGNLIGLSVVGGCFIAFALFSSFVAPRRWPEFPGEHGLPVFVIASVVLFAAMLTAVLVFGVEKSESAKGAEATGAAKTVQVQEKEYKVLPASITVPHGAVTFVVKNVGKIQHNLAISGKVKKSTALINPGGSAKLAVTLAKGTYQLYCTVPGHRQLGMLAKLTVT